MSVGLTVEQIAACVATDIADGSYVNLGIGMPMPGCRVHSRWL